MVTLPMSERLWIHTGTQRGQRYQCKEWKLFWQKGLRCPRGRHTSKTLHIKKSLGDISQFWKYKGWNIWIWSRCMIMTLYWGTENTLSLLQVIQQKESQHCSNSTSSWQAFFFFTNENTFSVFLMFKSGVLSKYQFFYSFPLSYTFMTDKRFFFNVLTKF